MKKGFFTFLLISVFSLTCVFTNVLPSYASQPCRCNGNHGYVAKKYIEFMDGSKVYAKVVKTLYHGDTVKAGESTGSKDGIDWILIHY